MNKLIFFICLIFSISVFAHNNSLEKKVSAQFKDISAKQALTQISKTHKLSIVIGKKTEKIKNISLNVKDVSLKDLFNFIAGPNDITWKVTENGMIFFE